MQNMEFALFVIEPVGVHSAGNGLSDYDDLIFHAT